MGSVFSSTIDVNDIHGKQDQSCIVDLIVKLDEFNVPYRDYTDDHLTSVYFCLRRKTSIERRNYIKMCLKQGRHAFQTHDWYYIQFLNLYYRLSISPKNQQRIAQYHTPSHDSNTIRNCTKDETDDHTLQSSQSQPSSINASHGTKTPDASKKGTKHSPTSIFRQPRSVSDTNTYFNDDEFSVSNQEHTRNHTTLAGKSNDVRRTLVKPSLTLQSKKDLKTNVAIEKPMNAPNVSENKSSISGDQQTVKILKKNNKKRQMDMPLLTKPKRSRRSSLFDETHMKSHWRTNHSTISWLDYQVEVELGHINPYA